MLRLGLCCTFQEQPIKFRTTTAAAMGRSSRQEALAKLALLCAANADALMATLQYCASHGIGCFRINSQILPIKTHPQQGYDVTELPGSEVIIERFRQCGEFSKQRNLRICFHPDQFVVLNSPRADVVASSIAELEYQAEVCEWIGADVINIHAGGAFGDKQSALLAFARNLGRLSNRVRTRLCLENDDRIFTPADLLTLCQAYAVPLVYDVHHHRCNPDDLSVLEATEQASRTWNREPLFHVSSPREGWRGPKPQRHHQYINPKDFPVFWQDLNITVEVEAKAKELAIARLRRSLARRTRSVPAQETVTSAHKKQTSVRN
jgi:UV DNA damage endonuclease